MPELVLDSSRKPLVKSICDKYPVYFEDVDVERILFVASDAKTAKKPVSLMRVKSPYHLAMAQKFILMFYTQRIQKTDSAKFNLYLLRELMRIESFEEGVLGPFPVQDFPEIIAKFGVDWEEQDTVPDVLKIVDEEKDEESDGEELELDEEVDAEEEEENATV